MYKVSLNKIYIEVSYKGFYNTQYHLQENFKIAVLHSEDPLHGVRGQLPH